MGQAAKTKTDLQKLHTLEIKPSKDMCWKLEDRNVLCFGRGSVSEKGPVLSFGAGANSWEQLGTWRFGPNLQYNQTSALVQD